MLNLEQFNYTFYRKSRQCRRNRNAVYIKRGKGILDFLESTLKLL